MMEFICAIPEEIGWALVGFVGAFTLMLAIQVGKDIVQAIKDRMEDDEEKCEE
jgi:hypothetical protein